MPCKYSKKSHRSHKSKSKPKGKKKMKKKMQNAVTYKMGY